MKSEEIMELLANPRNKVIVLVITAIIAFYVIYSGNDGDASESPSIVESLKHLATPILTAVSAISPEKDEIVQVDLMAPF